MTQIAHKRRKPDGRSVGRVSRQDWVDAARRALIKGGVDAVKVDRLAREMNITRGSFYWHFNARQDLLAAVLTDWADRAVEPFAEILENHHGAPRHQLERLLSLFSGRGGLDPALEAAIRSWARIDDAAAREVSQADEARIAMLEQALSALGYDREHAKARAKIAYFHQIGASLSGANSAAQSSMTELMDLMLSPAADKAEAMPHYASA